MKPFFGLLWRTAVAILAIAAVCIVGYACTVATRFQANAEYTRQVAELADVVADRLESGEDPAEVAADLREFRREYRPTYEGQPFQELLDKYLRREPTAAAAR